MIDRVYKFIQSVSNNELNGNVSPTDIKLLINSSVDELFEDNIDQLKRLTQRERRDGRSFSVENLSGKIREKIMHYYFTGESSKVDGRYNLPSDLRYLDTVEYEGNDVEPMQNRRQFKVVTNFIDTAPKLTSPIYLQLGNQIEVAPETVTEPVALYYLRNPKKANWTFTMVGTTPVFNPDASDFQDIDIHSSEEYNLCILILQKLGINLKEEQITQYGLTKENNDFQKENTN